MSNWCELLKAAMSESKTQFEEDRFEDKMCTLSDDELKSAGLHADFTCWGRTGWIYIPALIDGKPVVRRIKQRASPDVRKPWMLDRAKAVIAMWAKKDVEAEIIGSLMNGGNFGESSDADFLVTKCPEDLRYRIESDVEELMCGEPFHVVYSDKVSEKWIAQARRIQED